MRGQGAKLELSSSLWVTGFVLGRTVLNSVGETPGGMQLSTGYRWLLGYPRVLTALRSLCDPLLHLVCTLPAVSSAAKELGWREGRPTHSGAE